MGVGRRRPLCRGSQRNPIEEASSMLRRNTLLLWAIVSAGLFLAVPMTAQTSGHAVSRDLPSAPQPQEAGQTSAAAEKQESFLFSAPLQAASQSNPSVSYQSAP